MPKTSRVDVLAAPNTLASNSDAGADDHTNNTGCQCPDLRTGRVPGWA
jgi:hypothetical protein